MQISLIHANVSYKRVVVQSPSHVWLFSTPQTAASLFFTVSWSWLRLMSIELVMPSNYSSSVAPFSSCTRVFPSIKVFSNELAVRIKWPKYWSFSFSTSPSNEYSELIYFRIDWFDLFAVTEELFLFNFQNFSCVYCFFKNYQPKIILMPKRNILGWLMPLPFISFSFLR